MKSCEKLDVLMKLTRTSNSVLGKVLNFDASYISRIRSGKRSMPKEQAVLEPMAGFFAEHLRETYQKKLAADFLCPGSDWPEETPRAQQLLLAWLSQPDHSQSTPVSSILSGISAVRPGTPPQQLELQQETDTTEKVRFFYGDSGKRDAVAQFLTELCRMDHPPQLLLYSNEAFNWMYEDPAYAKKWAMLLFQYIQRGGRIKIAHTISRASGEMLVALQKWIPIYMTGAIEPYYYPKILDRVFRKTLFIAEGHSAIAASSVGEHTDQALNCLIRDPQAVRALEQEYWDFLSICKPLMQIFNLAGRERFLEVLRVFNDDCENLMVVRTTPSFYTMPASVARSMTKRQESGWVQKRQELGEASFRALLQRGKTMTEILNLPPAEQVLAGELAFPMCDLFEKPGLAYRASELAAHLQHVIDLLRQEPNYHVVLSSLVPANELVYVKEDVGVILIKSDVPTIAFAIHEQRMVAAFWDYLSELCESGSHREKTIRQLEVYVQKLEQPEAGLS